MKLFVLLTGRLRDETRVNLVRRHDRRAVVRVVGGYPRTDQLPHEVSHGTVPQASVLGHDKILLGNKTVVVTVAAIKHNGRRFDLPLRLCQEKALSKLDFIRSEGTVVVSIEAALHPSDDVGTYDLGAVDNAIFPRRHVRQVLAHRLGVAIEAGRRQDLVLVRSGLGLCQTQE